MILLFAMILGLAASGLTSIVRAVVPQSWLLVKPWSCNLCMSFHGSWVMLLVTSIDTAAPLPTIGEAGLLIAASTAVALLVTNAVSRLST